MTHLADQYVEKAEPPVYATEVEDPDFKLNLAVNKDARVVVYHNKSFRRKLSWLEFDLNRNRLNFVMNDGARRDFGIPISPDLAKYMQNAYQVLMVLIDERSGEAESGNYFPLIIHRT